MFVFAINVMIKQELLKVFLVTPAHQTMSRQLIPKEITINQLVKILVMKMNGY